jgi:hypothetical protein
VTAHVFPNEVFDVGRKVPALLFGNSLPSFVNRGINRDGRIGFLVGSNAGHVWLFVALCHLCKCEIVLQFRRDAVPTFSASPMDARRFSPKGARLAEVGDFPKDQIDARAKPTSQRRAWQSRRRESAKVSYQAMQ